METIEHNGVTFVKATALAKKHHYTTDYIGQLCRGGKVEAKLIGRAWFVSEDSLLGHKRDRYINTRSSEIIINKGLVSENSITPITIRREVRPVLSKATHRSVMLNNPGVTHHFENHGPLRTSTYHVDNGQLEPDLSQQAVPDSNDNLPEKGNKIKVYLGDKASAKLVFEELPEVSLRGGLAIDSLDDPDLFAEVEPVTAQEIRFTPEVVLKSSVMVTKRYQPTPNAKITVAPPEIVESTDEVSPVRFTPGLYSAETAPTSVKNSPLKQSRRFIIIPLFVSVSMALSVLMLGLASYSETDGLWLKQSLTFSTAAVVDSVSKIAKSY